MPARPEIRAFLSLRMFVLERIAYWISRVFLKRFFWVEDKETLNLKPKQKEALQATVFERSRLFNCRSNCRITERRRLGLISKRVLFSSHDLVQSVVSQTVN